MSSSPPPSSSSLRWAEGTVGSPGRPPGQHLPLGSGWVRPWAHFPSLVGPGNGHTGLSQRCRRFRSPLHTPPPPLSPRPGHPRACPLNPLLPVGCQRSCGTDPGGANFKTAVTETTQRGRPLCPPGPDVSRGAGLERSRLWYRQAGRAGQERETCHIYGTASKVQAKRGRRRGREWQEEGRGEAGGTLRSGGLTRPRR